MATADSHILPVIKDGKVLGVVHAMDVLNDIRSAYRGLKCDELASMKIVTINENADLGTAITQFSRKGIDHLPVIDDNGKLVGMLSMSDLIENNLFWGSARQKVTASAPGRQGNKRSGEKTTAKSPQQNRRRLDVDDGFVGLARKRRAGTDRAGPWH